MKNIQEIIQIEKEIKDNGLEVPHLRLAKENGISDKFLSLITNHSEEKIRNERIKNNIIPVYKMVDTCAAEFEAYTPYLYSTYQEEDESSCDERKKILILGGGPNRIGQGIEFDYCCVHASFALKEDGYQTIMVNCNPETVSTDYDTSDKLYFEPLTIEDTVSIINKEKPDGIIVHFGGQTPLKLALDIEASGGKIIGTSPDSIDLAEDRERFNSLMKELNVLQPESAIAKSSDEALLKSKDLGFPIIVRPSYVLGGRAMEIVYSESELEKYLTEAVKASNERPVLMDRFLNDAKEVDVDAISDGSNVCICGILEHIEEAGIHSGDSTMVLPPYSLSRQVINDIKEKTKDIGLKLKVKGFLNIQYAIKDEKIFIIEVNPRASRTVPFISKAVGVPLAKMASRIMAGKSLEELSLPESFEIDHFCVKESVFPFIKFPNVDTILGPEMKSTGEVMGIDKDLYAAFAKAQIAAGNRLPSSGTAFISIKDSDKAKILPVAKKLVSIGFHLVTTVGTNKFLKDNSIESKLVKKVKDGNPNIIDLIKNDKIDLVINTTFSNHEIVESFSIRRTSLIKQIPYFTTIAGATAGVNAIDYLNNGSIEVKPLQDYF